ncbi:MAG TPA: hypothetical protein PK720_01575 [bacterium]|nr:hypothetical protein [bacterium]
MGNIIIWYGNGDEHRFLSSAAARFGVEVTREACGVGEDDIGAGVRMACYKKKAIFPNIKKETLKIKVFRHYEYFPVEVEIVKLVKRLGEKKHPKFEGVEISESECPTGGPHIMPIWEEWEQETVDGKIVSSLGSVFSGIESPDIHRVNNNWQWFNYHCSTREEVETKIKKISNGFYDPLEFPYVLQGTGWGNNFLSYASITELSQK